MEEEDEEEGGSALAIRRPPPLKGLWEEAEEESGAWEVLASAWARVS